MAGGHKKALILQVGAMIMAGVRFEPREGLHVQPAPGAGIRGKERAVEDTTSCATDQLIEHNM